jgi:hypothetical protein
MLQYLLRRRKGKPLSLCRDAFAWASVLSPEPSRTTRAAPEEASGLDVRHHDECHAHAAQSRNSAALPEQLAQLAALFESGALTQEEFVEAKSQLLNT